MRLRLTVLLLVPFALACTEAAPTGIDGATPNFGVAGNSGCYTVKFSSHAAGLFPSFPGAVLTGDLEGTVDVLFDFQTVRFAGVTIKNEGLATWSITGGIIPELIGKTFETVTSPINVRSPDQEPLLVRINGKDRALSGVNKANLTYQGTFDGRDGTPPFEVDLNWQGVICP